MSVKYLAKPNPQEIAQLYLKLKGETMTPEELRAFERKIEEALKSGAQEKESQ